MDDLQNIFNSIKAQKCLPFLGAGACTPFTDKDGNTISGLPTGSGLSEALADACNYVHGSRWDLLEVAEYFVYAHNGDRDELGYEVKRQILNGCKPRPIHTVLAQIPQIKVMITSNYDLLLEEELRTYQRLVKRHVHNPRNPKTGHFQGTFIWDDRDVILHKMHGTIEQPESLVITRSDYIRYLTDLHDLDRGMPDYFRKHVMPQCTLLFLGYSLADWNFQVIWEGVLAQHKAARQRKISYALMKDPNEQNKTFWASRGVKLLDMDLNDFACTLANEFNLEIPQLGIQSGEIYDPKSL